MNERMDDRLVICVGAPLREALAAAAERERRPLANYARKILTDAVLPEAEPEGAPR